MSMWKYDVYMSFGSEPICKGFLDQLYNDFKQNGIRVYRDDDFEDNFHTEGYAKSMILIDPLYHKYFPNLRYSLCSTVANSFKSSYEKHLFIVFEYKPEAMESQTGCFGEALAINEAAYGAEVHEWRKALSMAATFDGRNIIDTRNGFKSFIDEIIKGVYKIQHEESSGKNLVESFKGFELYSSFKRRLAIYWDIENSPIPTDVYPGDIAENIKAFVQRETKINWEFDDVYAYGDFSKISNEKHVKLLNSGVKLLHTPRDKKDTTFNALLVALFKRSRDCPPPSSIMLITGNIYFASTLHALRRFGHNIILAISSEVGVSTSLINASNFNWYWSNVAKGPTSSSQVKIEELPDDNYNWYRSNLVKGEDLVPTSSSQIKKVSLGFNFFKAIRPLEFPLERRLFISWDLENCSIPGEMHAKDVLKNILAFVKLATKTDWVVRISVYADFSLIPKVKADLKESGVHLIDTPHVKKDAADEAMMVDLFTYSNYYPPPSSIMPITGDGDFSMALHELRGFGHDIYLAFQSGSRVSKSLINASKYWWYWSDVANGRIEEPSHVDLTGLKGQLVELLESSGGKLSLGSLATEYQKIFKKKLRPSEYKSNKLVDLLKKMSDVISVEKLKEETLVKLKG